MRSEQLGTLTVGGVSKEELRARLAAASVSLNEYAESLFASPEFGVSEQPRHLGLVAVSLHDLGLTAGGSLPVIFERAASLGYGLCPLEAAPHLRLAPVRQTAGSYLTVASARPRPTDPDFPAGFYLRRLEDGLWLRGYRTDGDWIWPPDFSRFVFSIPNG